MQRAGFFRYVNLKGDSQAVKALVFGTNMRGFKSYSPCQQNKGQTYGAVWRLVMTSRQRWHSGATVTRWEEWQLIKEGQHANNIQAH